MYKHTCTLIALLSLALTIGETVQAKFRFDIVAVTGDAAPDGNGTFTNFSVPTLNDSGQVAFGGVITDTLGINNVSGIYRGDKTGGLVEFARVGDAAPGGNGSLSGFPFPYLNNVGQIAFRANLSGTSGGNIDDVGIYRSDGTGNPLQIIREGETAPDGDGTFSSVVFGPILNNAGQVAIFGALSGTSGGGSLNAGIYRGDGSSSPVQIARNGEAVPDGNGTYSKVSIPVLNNAGQTAFFANLGDTSGGDNDSQGIFIGDGVDGPSRIVRSGEAAPDGNGIFVAFLDSPDLNDMGQAAFIGFLADTTGGTSDDEGIFVGDSSISPVQIARAGKTVPDGDGFFTGFGSPALNTSGQVAFTGNFTTTTASTGVFRGDGVNTLLEIARRDDVAPDGNGAFLGFRSPDINDIGQLAFIGTHSATNGGSSDDVGLYFYDDLLGLKQVVREGDPLLGSTITRIRYPGPVGRRPDNRSAFNELGQLAYQFELADGRSGIAIASLIPEPSTLLLGLLAVSTLLLRKRN